MTLAVARWALTKSSEIVAAIKSENTHDESVDKMRYLIPSGALEAEQSSMDLGNWCDRALLPPLEWPLWDEDLMSATDVFNYLHIIQLLSKGADGRLVKHPSIPPEISTNEQPVCLKPAWEVLPGFFIMPFTKYPQYPPTYTTFL